jgi:hypothetical protein
LIGPCHYEPFVKVTKHKRKKLSKIDSDDFKQIDHSSSASSHTRRFAHKLSALKSTKREIARISYHQKYFKLFNYYHYEAPLQYRLPVVTLHFNVLAVSHFCERFYAFMGTENVEAGCNYKMQAHYKLSSSFV